MCHCNDFGPGARSRAVQQEAPVWPSMPLPETSQSAQPLARAGRRRGGQGQGSGHIPHRSDEGA
eukprot:9146528-Alexandrium_andersonii.AAC.1